MAQYVVNFTEAEYAHDQSPPAGWTNRWGTIGTWSVRHVPGGIYAGDAGVRWSTVASDARMFLAWSDLGTIEGDVDIYCRVRTENTSNNQNRVHLHSTGAAGTERGYFAELLSGNTFQVAKYNTSGSFAAVASASFSWAIDTWYWIRVQRTGTTLRAKVWADGGAEPGSWTVSGTDTDYDSGEIGIGFFTRGFKYWDTLFVGTDTESAPVEPTPPKMLTVPALGREFSVGDVVSLEWGTAAHPNAASLQYEGEVRVNGGGWAPLFALQSDLDFEWDTDGVTGGIYEIRIRAHDGSVYGGWSMPHGVLVHAAPTYQQDFALKPTGADIADWRKHWSTNNHVPAAISGAVGGRALESWSAGLAARTPEVIPAHGYSRVRMRVWTGTTLGNVERRAGPAVRVSGGSSDSANGYVLQFNGGGARNLFLSRWVNGTLTNLDTAGVDSIFTAGGYYWLELEADGDQLRGRFWADGGEPPETWQVEATDSAHAAGFSGFVTEEGTFGRRVDVVEIETLPGLVAPFIEAHGTDVGEITVLQISPGTGWTSVALYRAIDDEDLPEEGPESGAVLVDDDWDGSPAFVTGLDADETYYFAAYATDGEETVRSSIVSATTPRPSGLPCRPGIDAVALSNTVARLTLTDCVGG